jgi:hypothetical protein
MSDQVTRAIEAALPSLEGVDGVGRAPWVDDVEAWADLWLGGLKVVHVDVSVEDYSDQNNVERSRVTISIFCDGGDRVDGGVLAQGTADYAEYEGARTARIGGWTMLPYSAITSLNAGTARLGTREVEQLVVEFEGISGQVVVPSDLAVPVDAEVFRRILRGLRDAWISNGASARTTAARR